MAQQVDDIALYWFTGTGASAASWWLGGGPMDAARRTPSSAEAQNAQTLTVPTACTLFPGERFPVARRWAERRYLVGRQVLH